MFGSGISWQCFCFCFCFRGRIIGILFIATLSNECSWNHIALMWTVPLYIWCTPVFLESPFAMLLVLSHLTSVCTSPFSVSFFFLLFLVHFGGSHLQVIFWGKLHESWRFLRPCIWNYICSLTRCRILQNFKVMFYIVSHCSFVVAIDKSEVSSLVPILQ